MAGKKTSGKDRADTTKLLRTEPGLTQEQFAAKVGVTFPLSTFTPRMERDRKIVRDSERAKIW